MWLRTLQQWLDHRTPASGQRCEAAFRLEQELNEPALRKIEDALRDFRLSPRSGPISSEREPRRQPVMSHDDGRTPNYQVALSIRTT